ncbi:hypothetical protein BGX24_004894 [Mortierella sp. AD032]|nr:hypothetical protein BGX24_004894 [Mortierella sp. AD032]
MSESQFIHLARRFCYRGEKMLEASKIMRKWQTEEYGDVSEAGRKGLRLHSTNFGSWVTFQLQEGSHQLLFTFLELQAHLERQGPQIVRAKEHFDGAAEKTKLSNGLTIPRGRAPFPKARKFQNSVTLTPSKKRSWTTGTV